MHRPALLTLGLTLLAGAAIAAAPADRLAPLQGDWPNGGSTVTIKGSSARVTRVSAEDRKAGYGEGEVLVQGLAYQRTDTLNNGDKRLTFTGTCRTPTAGRKATTWVVSDCTLELTQPGDGGGARLAAINGSELITGRRGAAQAPQTKAQAPTVRDTTDLAGAKAPPKVKETAAKPPEEAKPPADPNETWARRTMTPEELAAQDAGTQRLNADINARNAAIDARNKKADADFKAAQAARDAQIKATKAAHDREMADYQARVAAQNAANAKAHADWEAAVKACKAGDKTKCAQP